MDEKSCSFFCGLLLNESSKCESFSTMLRVKIIFNDMEALVGQRRLQIAWNKFWLVKVSMKRLKIGLAILRLNMFFAYS